MASIEHPTAIAASAIVAFRTALAQTETATLTDAERIELVTEWTARLVAEAAADLDPRQRYELDERLGPDLPRLSSRQARVAAQRIVADIDAEVVQRRMDRARRGRRVSMRVVGDGMAYLSILAPMTEVAGPTRRSSSMPSPSSPARSRESRRPDATDGCAAWAPS